MDSATQQQVLEKMISKQAVRIFDLTSHEGENVYYASPEELALLESNPDAFYAGAHRLTLEEYREWAGNEYSLVCTATTKAGKRCTNFLPGGFQVSRDEWLERFGDPCVNHEGSGRKLPTSATAKV